MQLELESQWIGKKLILSHTFKLILRSSVHVSIPIARLYSLFNVADRLHGISYVLKLYHFLASVTSYTVIL